MKKWIDAVDSQHVQPRLSRLIRLHNCYAACPGFPVRVERLRRLKTEIQDERVCGTVLTAAI
jgi:hypothetical protein